MINYILNGKATIFLSIVGLISEYFPEPHSSEGRVKVELDLSKYVTKADFKNVTGVYTSDFAIKTDLANLKSDVNKLEKCTN